MWGQTARTRLCVPLKVKRERDDYDYYIYGEREREREREKKKDDAHFLLAFPKLILFISITFYLLLSFLPSIQFIP